MHQGLHWKILLQGTWKANVSRTVPCVNDGLIAYAMGTEHILSGIVHVLLALGCYVYL